MAATTTPTQSTGPWGSDRPIRPWWRSPIVIWATIGALTVLLMGAVLGQWLAAGLTSVDPGPDQLSTGRLILLRVMEWGQFAALIVLVAQFVVRPLVHRQPLGFDGLFIITLLALHFWDPLDNYLNFAFQYNAHFFNVKSWGEFIPGWASGPDTWVVPWAFVFGAYTWAFFLAARVGCGIVVRLERARPNWESARRFAVVFVVCAAVAAVAELAYLQTYSIANIGTPDALTLWSERFNGWPMYNPIFFGLAFTAVAWLRWSCDELGFSAVERGIDQLPTLPRRFQTIVRFLAIFAFVQVSYIALYFVPWNLFGLAHDAWPVLPSYFPVP